MALHLDQFNAQMLDEAISRVAVDARPEGSGIFNQRGIGMLMKNTACETALEQALLSFFDAQATNNPGKGVGALAFLLHLGIEIGLNLHGES